MDDSFDFRNMEILPSLLWPEESRMESTIVQPSNCDAAFFNLNSFLS